MWVYWKMSLAVESMIIMSDSILNNEVSSEVGKGQTNETITHSAVTFYMCQIWYMCACLYVGRYSPLTDSVTLSRSNSFTHKMFTALMTVEDTRTTPPCFLKYIFFIYLSQMCISMGIREILVSNRAATILLLLLLHWLVKGPICKKCLFWNPIPNLSNTGALGL